MQLNTPVVGSGATARNTCVIAPGRMDRSPTGTGLSARLAVLQAKGILGMGDTLTHESIIGSRFDGRIEEVTKVGPLAAVVPSIRGRAWITGFSNYVLDSSDPYPEGYRISDTWPGSLDMRQ